MADEVITHPTMGKMRIPEALPMLDFGGSLGRIIGDALVLDIFVDAPGGKESVARLRFPDAAAFSGFIEYLGAMRAEFTRPK